MNRLVDVNNNAPLGAAPVGVTDEVENIINPLCDTCNKLLLLVPNTCKGVFAEEVICTPLFTDNDVVAFLIKKKSLEMYEEVDTILVLEPIKNTEPVVFNDPVRIKLPVIKADPVNGNVELPPPEPVNSFTILPDPLP